MHINDFQTRLNDFQTHLNAFEFFPFSPSLSGRSHAEILKISRQYAEILKQRPTSAVTLASLRPRCKPSITISRCVALLYFLFFSSYSNTIGFTYHCQPCRARDVGHSTRGYARVRATVADVSGVQLYSMHMAFTKDLAVDALFEPLLVLKPRDSVREVRGGEFTL